MIYENMEFHNVMELQKLEGIPGLRLQRFPKEIRENLGFKEHLNGRIVSQPSTGCEIRFLTDSKVIHIYLSALTHDGTVLVYNGNFFHSMHILKAGVMTTLVLEENDLFDTMNPEALENFSFSHKVWRICMSRGFSAFYHGIDTFGASIRPPKPNEKPKLRWLAYGSSITYGINSTTHNNSYIEQTARRLGVDVINNGLSGACLCEDFLADYLANRQDWDFATLELGVNMRTRLNREQFETRTRYFIKKFVEMNPDKPVIIITIYPNRAIYLKNKDDDLYIKDSEFNKILNDIYKEYNHKNLYILQGNSILTDFSGLCSDLLHPSDYGHTIMGENLARELSNIVSNYYV